MSRFPTNVSPAQLRAAFNDHRVNFATDPRTSNGRSRWSQGLRGVAMHHTAGKNSLGHVFSTNLPAYNSLIQNGNYNGRANDGRMVICSWGDAWHTGQGGPWSGIASRDSGHLTLWGMSLESLGTRNDVTDAMLTTAQRALAALVDLGVPVSNIIRHADWTNATAGVTGPAQRPGRKIDTNQQWFPTSRWRDLARNATRHWDGHVPPFDNIMRSSEAVSPEDRTAASWRVACRLADMGFFSGTPQPRDVQGYPRNAVRNWQRSINTKDTGNWGPNAHRRIFGVEP